MEKMSNQTRQEYYDKLHQTIAEETGVDARIVSYLRGVLGRSSKEELKRHLEDRIARMSKNLVAMREHLKSKSPKRVKRFESYKQQIAGTEKGLEFRRKVLNVLNTADTAKMASITREDHKPKNQEEIPA